VSFSELFEFFAVSFKTDFNLWRSEALKCKIIVALLTVTMADPSR
jgi:hypothetical protein